jgi:hypothetical protein
MFFQRFASVQGNAKFKNSLQALLKRPIDVLWAALPAFVQISDCCGASPIGRLVKDLNYRYCTSTVL